MEFKEKLSAIRTLQDDAYIQADRYLLKEIAPRNPLTWQAKAKDNDVLFILLDHKNAEDIIAFRHSFVAVSPIPSDKSGEPKKKFNFFSKKHQKNGKAKR